MVWIWTTSDADPSQIQNQWKKKHQKGWGEKNVSFSTFWVLPHCSPSSTPVVISWTSKQLKQSPEVELTCSFVIFWAALFLWYYIAIRCWQFADMPGFVSCTRELKLHCCRNYIMMRPLYHILTYIYHRQYDIAQPYLRISTLTKISY